MGYRDHTDSEGASVKRQKVLPNHGISAPPPGLSDYPNVVRYRGLAYSEGSIAKRLKVLPGHGSPAPPPSSSDYPNVVGYRDLYSVHNPALAISELPTGVFEPYFSDDILHNPSLVFPTSWSFVTSNLLLIALSLSATHSAISFNFSSRILRMIFCLAPVLELQRHSLVFPTPCNFVISPGLRILTVVELIPNVVRSSSVKDVIMTYRPAQGLLVVHRSISLSVRLSAGKRFDVKPSKL